MEKITVAISGGSEKQNTWATEIAQTWVDKVLAEASDIQARIDGGREQGEFLNKLIAYKDELMNNAKVLAETILPKAGAKTIIEQRSSAVLVTRAIKGAKNRAGF